MFILIDVLSWGAHTHTHIHVYCSPGTDLGYEVGGWCAVDGSRVLNKKKKSNKKKASYYIRYSAVSVLLAVLVLLPKPNHHVVMSHPQRQ